MKPVSPCDAIMELIKNAFDAGSSIINVDVNPDRLTARVCDNGRGITPEALGKCLTCISPHKAEIGRHPHGLQKAARSCRMFSVFTHTLMGELTAIVLTCAPQEGETVSLGSYTATDSLEQRLLSAPGTVIMLRGFHERLPSMDIVRMSFKRRIHELRGTRQAVVIINGKAL